MLDKLLRIAEWFAFCLFFVAFTAIEQVNRWEKRRAAAKRDAVK